MKGSRLGPKESNNFDLNFFLFARGKLVKKISFLVLIEGFIVTE